MTLKIITAVVELTITLFYVIIIKEIDLIFRCYYRTRFGCNDIGTFVVPKEVVYINYIHSGIQVYRQFYLLIYFLLMTNYYL